MWGDGEGVVGLYTGKVSLWFCMSSMWTDRDSSFGTARYFMTCLRVGSTGEDGVEICFPSVKAALPFLR